MRIKTFYAQAVAQTSDEELRQVASQGEQALMDFIHEKARSLRDKTEKTIEQTSPRSRRRPGRNVVTWFGDGKLFSRRFNPPRPADGPAIDPQAVDQSANLTQPATAGPWVTVEAIALLDDGRRIDRCTFTVAKNEDDELEIKHLLDNAYECLDEQIRNLDDLCIDYVLAVAASIFDEACQG